MRVIFFLCALSALPAQGFVLLSRNKSTLPVSPLSPQLTFIWDGSAPTIEEKEDYQDGAYADLDDRAFMQVLLNQSVALWSSIPGSYLQFAITTGETSMNDTDKVFSLVVQKSENLSTAAFAKPSQSADGRWIEDCDISISDRATSAKALAYTITHELGHCVGLGHPHTNYNSIMGYSRMARTISLGADDWAGAIFLYPDPAYYDGNSKELIAVCGQTGIKTRGSWMLAVILVLLPTAVIATLKTA